MKNLIVLNILCLAWLGMPFRGQDDAIKICGEWNTQFNDGSSFTINFFTDGTYTSVISLRDGFPDGKYKDVIMTNNSTSGFFRINGNNLLITSNSGCMGVWGKYKIAFRDDESVQLSLINDNCESRAVTISSRELWRR